MNDNELGSEFLIQSRRYLTGDFLPKIQRCVDQLTPEEIWWRPNDNSNSIGNLLLHLEGNVRQWIISGIGRARDTRQRDTEFRERRQLSPAELLEKLSMTVEEAAKVLEHVTSERLLQNYDIQVYSVTGLQAILHVVEHFSHHTGQIIYVTKLIKNCDLEFYDL